MTDTELEGLSDEEKAYLDPAQYEEDGEPEGEGGEGDTVEAKADHEPETPEGDGEGNGEEAGEDGEDKPKMVPHAALHETRLKHKEAEAKARELEQKLQMYQAVDDRFNRFAEMQAKQQQAQPQEQEPIPNKDEDPFGYIDYLDKQVKGLSEQQQRQQAEHQQQAQLQQFQAAVTAEEAEFAKQVPDYTEAAAFLRDSYARELEAMGTPPHQINNALRNQLLNLAVSAKEAGRSVPEVAYSLAQGRGYKGKEETKTSDDAEEALKKVEEGQRVNRNVSGAGNGSGGKMTLEKFAKLPEDEAFAWMAKNGEQALDRLFR